MKKQKKITKNLIAQKLMTFGLIIILIINMIFMANKAFGTPFAEDSFYDFMSKQEHVEQEIDDFQIQNDLINLENVILFLLLN